MDTGGALYLGVKWLRHLRHKADHSFPSSVKDKNKGNYTSSHPACLHGMDNITFTSIMENFVLRVLMKFF
jgi:hypothetical protein